MKEYRIRAYFNGDIYGNRTYKGKVFTSEAEVKILFEDAIDYYLSKPCYQPYLEKIVIEEREVSEWEKMEE